MARGKVEKDALNVHELDKEDRSVSNIFKDRWNEDLSSSDAEEGNQCFEEGRCRIGVMIIDILALEAYLFLVLLL